MRITVNTPLKENPIKLTQQNKHVYFPKKSEEVLYLHNVGICKKMAVSRDWSARPPRTVGARPRADHRGLRRRSE